MVTKQEILNAFIAEERADGFYKNLTDEQKIARNLIYTQLKIDVSIEVKKVSDFNVSKDEAFKSLAQEHDAERIALGKVWQTFEDNDYTIEE